VTGHLLAQVPIRSRSVRTGRRLAIRSSRSTPPTCPRN